MEKENFWNSRILRWEEKNYLRPLENRGFSSTVRNRLLLANRILAPEVKDRRVLDLGCGSGWLLRSLKDMGARRLAGIDLSQSAVKAGNAEGGVELIHGDVVHAEWPEADLICGLGLLDWLSDEEIRLVMHRIGSRKFLLSFSEARPSLHRLLHRGWVMSSYGWRNPEYVPRYHTENEIRCWSQAEGHRDLQFHRRRGLSFGTLVTNFPVQVTE